MSKTRKAVNRSAETAEIAVHSTPDWMNNPTIEATTTTIRAMNR
jgi:hypothetical protein